MSTQEVERLTVIRQVVEKRLKQRQAMQLLRLSKRQVIRLAKAYRRDGPAALVSKQRGQPSNNRHDSSVKIKAKELVQKHYHDFGPTFASEKLEERHKIIVNKETLRQWMIEWELWKAKRHKKVKVHQSRLRRACFGELIQIDGSHHDWLEGRAPKCCLLVFIDDATSRLVGLRFEKSETTVGYFKLAREYMEKHGRPLAFYSDKYGVFRVNLPNCEHAETQFGRAMRELGIESICANSPQAKGRVENANGTLQDRLIKEMRLRGISSIEEANAYLPKFMEDWDRRFAVEPRSLIEAHRKDLPDTNTLNLIFSFQYDRKLSKKLELSYDNIIYQIKTTKPGYGLRHATVKVCEDLSGIITLLYKGHPLEYVCHKKQKRSPEIMGAKQLDKKIEEIKKYIPGPNHPWRQYAQIISVAKDDAINSSPQDS
ncbi:MAG TPA: ISNCY family transposase [Hanamia sp.]